MTPLGRGTGIPGAVSLIQIGVEVYLMQSNSVYTSHHQSSVQTVQRSY
jgi:hypothetical protein